MLVGIGATLAGREPPRAGGRAGGLAGAACGCSVVEPFADFTAAALLVRHPALRRAVQAGRGAGRHHDHALLPVARASRATTWPRSRTVFGLAATLVGAVAGGWLVGRIGVGRALMLTGLDADAVEPDVRRAGRRRARHADAVRPGGRRELHRWPRRCGLPDLPVRPGEPQPSARRNMRCCPRWRRCRCARWGRRAGCWRPAMGWTSFFLLTTAAALPAMAIMLFLLRRLPPPQRPHGSTPMNPWIVTPLLLVGSNVLMTFAWYGHLKAPSWPLWLAIAGVLGDRLLRILPGGAGQPDRLRHLHRPAAEGDAGGDHAGGLRACSA